MSAKSRLSALLGHFSSAEPQGSSPEAPARYEHRVNFHTLSPTFFLPRAAAIEPEVSGIAPLLLVLFELTSHFYRR